MEAHLGSMEFYFPHLLPPLGTNGIDINLSILYGKETDFKGGNNC